MRSLFCRLSFLPLLLLSAQAAVLRGVTIADALGGPPLSNVVIQVSGLPDIRTDPHGRFSIPLAQSGPSDSVLLNVSLPGYTVVNATQLEIALPRDEGNTMLTVLLTREPVQEEMSRRFFRTACLEATQARARQRPNIGRDSAREDDVDSRREQQLASRAADILATEFARVPPEVMSPLYRHSLNLFLNGHVERALGSLDDQQLREFQRTSESSEEQYVEHWLLKARILTTQFRFDEARSAHKVAVADDPGSHSAWLGLARFEQSLRQQKDSQQAFLRALALARTSGRTDTIAHTLVGLGHVHREQGQFDEALRRWREALNLRRPPAAGSPVRDLPGFASLLIDVGNVLMDIQQFAAARDSYHEALAIYQSLARNHPLAFAPNVAATQSNLGVLSGIEGKPDEARRTFETALQSQRLLVPEGTLSHRRDLAQTLYNLGLLEQSQKRLSKARSFYVEALALFRALAREQPMPYMGDVADTLNNLGLLHRDEGRFAEATEILREALAAYRYAARENPERYQRSIERLQIRLRELEKVRSADSEALDSSSPGVAPEP